MSGSRIFFADTYDIGSDAAVAAAESAGVCIRPHVRTVTDRATGESVSVPIACGSTREAVCGPCATKARRLRIHQCREGWHLADDPLPKGARTVRGGEGVAESETGEYPDDEEPTPHDVQSTVIRTVRSTRRLAGFPDLPTLPMDARTVGREYVDERTGRAFRPSMFVTLTLPSYGKVIEGTGVPRNPDRYDYRRAALDALLWPRLLDRFWQNLRRCAGYQVQYFSAIEAQRRLAPHLHAAVRGAIPRATIKAVVAATYHVAWWPSLDEPTYVDRWPVYDRHTRSYLDPDTGVALPTWAEATGQLEEPAHVVAFGQQVDVKGLLGGTEDSDRAVRYLCKYLAKNVADTYTGQHPTDQSTKSLTTAYERHINRLHAEVLVLPCSSCCPNWLRYGVTPKDAGPGLVPGLCPSPAHDRENLGLGGRRVLVSRQWTGKTLTEHRADRREVVAQVLREAGIEAPDADRLAADRTLPDGTPRYVWSDTDPGQVTYVSVIAASLRQAQAWREQYQEAKAIAADGQRGSPPVDTNSATRPAA